MKNISHRLLTNTYKELVVKIAQMKKRVFRTQTAVTWTSSLKMR